jgi:hypothetical protein
MKQTLDKKDNNQEQAKRHEYNNTFLNLIFIINLIDQADSTPLEFRISA